MIDDDYSFYMNAIYIVSKYINFLCLKGLIVSL